MRIGHGYDVHRLVSGRALILGGVTIPYEKGLDGHSDADVLVHAVMDALLGAAAMGDIGKLLNPWYNAKNIAVGYDDNPEGVLFTPELRDEVLAGFRELMPLYLYLDSLAGDPEPNKE